MTIQMIGVSKTIRMFEIEHLSDPEQDELIKSILTSCERELAEMVGGAHPRGDLVAKVEGPYSDPIQGLIYIHTVAGHFELDELPLGSIAYKIHVSGEGYTPTLDEDPERAAKFRAVYDERFGLRGDERYQKGQR